MTDKRVILDSNIKRKNTHSVYVFQKWLRVGVLELVKVARAVNIRLGFID